MRVTKSRVMNGVQRGRDIELSRNGNQFQQRFRLRHSLQTLARPPAWNIAPPMTVLPRLLILLLLIHHTASSVSQASPSPVVSTVDSTEEVEREGVESKAYNTTPA